MLDLAAEDFDALYAVVQAEMPRVSRDLFPAVLARLVRDGVIMITVTDVELTINMPGLPGPGVFRAERRRSLH